MQVISSLYVLIFFVLLWNSSEARLRLKRRAADTISKEACSNKPFVQDGKNVCVFYETKTIWEEKQTVVTETKTQEVCCKKLFKCWKKCKRTKVYTKLENRKISKLVKYPVCFCCNGWSRDGEQSIECTKPICNPYCRNNGVCVGPNQCKCNNGTTGRYCQLDVDECALGAPCQQRCINLPGTYQCACKKGYVPEDPKSEKCVDINECLKKPCKCASGKDDCGVKCINKQGGYQCTCGSKYRLARNNLCVDKNECLTNPDICPHKCVNQNGGYQCQCFQGFDYDPAKKQCVPKNFCDGFKSSCEHECHPVFGGYVCTCRNGYYLHTDRHKCIDFNECSNVNPCDPQTSQCINTQGSYYCVCKVGFIRSGVICDDFDECKNQTALCEQKCINKFGSYACACHPGYKLNKDGITCDDIDECQTIGKRVCSQQCINTIGSYACACNPGYSIQADKKTCQANLCMDLIDPFYGKAICEGNTVGKKCTLSCDVGFQLDGPSIRTCLPTGKWSGKKTICKPKSCGVPKPPSNGKVTLPCDLNYGSSCPISCLDGYILRGDDLMTCQIYYNKLQWVSKNTKCEEILVCKPNPCMNGGQCSIVTDTEYICNCTNTHYTGLNCEQLVVSLSKIPKLTINQPSPMLSITSSPQKTLEVVFYPEDPQIGYSPLLVKLSKGRNEVKYKIQSKIAGLKWVSYDLKSEEIIQRLPDSLLFFYDQSIVKSIPGNTLKHFVKDCFHVKATPKSCPSLNMIFSSTKSWQGRNAGLVSTNGVVFLNIMNSTFPIALPRISITSLFHDFINEASVSIDTQSKQTSCTPSSPSEGETQTIIKNDMFTKYFIEEYNKLTPSWFILSLDEQMKYIHEDNIRSYIWSGQRVKQNSYCHSAAIDEKSLFLVYLHHEKLSMKVNGKSIVMKTDGKFCLLIDLCKQEPHLVIPNDNYGHLETVFSFEDIQKLGWKVSVQSVGFRKGLNVGTDERHCGSTQTRVAFGTTKISYQHKTYIHGGMKGNLFMDVINRNGKKEISTLNQCFDGQSRFDTPTWYTTDTLEKKYTKPKESHKLIQTTAKKPTSKSDIFTIMQAKDSIFKVKTGLKPILQKTTQSGMNINFLYKDKQATSKGGSTGDDNFEKITALQMLQLPLGDLEMNMMNIFITTEPLLTLFTTLQTKISSWGLVLMNDINDCWTKFDDVSFVLSKVKDNYYKTGPAITELKNLIIKMESDTQNNIDPSTIQLMKNSINDLNLALVELAKYAVVAKPTKDFQFVTLNFIAETCLFPPCITQTNVTLYPSKYDLKLSGLCHDPTKGPYDIWQVEGKILNDQEKGSFFSFYNGDKFYLCLSKHGVQTAKLQVGIKRFDDEIKGTYILQNGKIDLPTTDLRVFGKYKFSVDSTLDFELKNWQMVSMTSIGNAGSTSTLITDIQKQLDEYSTYEYHKLTRRVNTARNIIKQSLTDTSFYKNKIQKEDAPKVKEMENKLTETKILHKRAVEHFKKWEKEYDSNRQKMFLIEQKIAHVCTVKSCPFTCHMIPKCEICQEPWMINKSIPECKKHIEDRSYKYLKSEHDTCTHTVKDRSLKYTGNCKEPGAEPSYAQNVIDRLNEKIKKKIPLTISDAYALESINKEKGRELRQQIEKKLFFDNFPHRLTNCLLIDEDFKKLATYTNQTFSDKTRKKMQDIKNTKIMNNIVKKMNESIPLSDEDYEKLKKIDPKLEKNIRKSQAIGEITKKIQLTGNVTEEDLAKLREIAPEYSKNITKAMKQQEIQKQVLEDIQKKMGNGTLSPEDLKALKEINPGAAAKLEAALKEQLEQRVKEMENKLKTVKGAIDQGLNNTGFKDLQSQLNILSGSLKPYDKEALKKLQEKIRANNATSGSVFEEVFERLDLAYDIRNLTGNSGDLKRVFDNFFAVLPKFDVPLILQRSALGVAKGLHNIQGWFQMSAKLIEQACTRCERNCSTDQNIITIMKYFSQNLQSFDIKICKSSWKIGVKIQAITDICKLITQTLTFSQTITSTHDNTCTSLQTRVVLPLKNIVGKWKDARESMEKLNKQQWKKSKTTSEMLANYDGFIKQLHKAYSTELGKTQISFLSKDELFTNVEARLDDENNAVSLAELEVLYQLLTSVVQGIETLPNAIKQNKQTAITMTTNEKNQILDHYNKLVQRLENFLKTVCEDKKPEKHPKFRHLPLLISRSVKELQSFLNSKTITDLLTYSQRYNQFAKQMLLVGESIKNSMLPCQLRQEKVEVDQSVNVDKALVSLKEFISNIKPLEQKSIKDLANDIKNIMSSFGTNGLTSPIGKLVELMSNFLDDSPAFNLPIIITLPPVVSKLALTSFEDYISSTQQFFNGIDDVLQKCEDGCSPQDIFGKTNLADIARKLDEYLKPLSKNLTGFTRTIKITPQGVSLLTASFEEIRTALQTLSRSETGFNKDGIKSIIRAFKTAKKSISNLRNGTKALFKSFAGPMNKDIQNLKNNLVGLRQTTTKLFEYSKGKLQNIKLVYEKIEKLIEKLTTVESSNEKESVLESRLNAAKETAVILNDVGSQFEVMYSMNLDSVLDNYIDTSYAPDVATQLDAVQKSGAQLLNNTKQMSDSAGIELPMMDESTIFNTDLAQMINDVASSMGSRKSRLAKGLTSAANKISNAIDSFSKRSEEIVNAIVGKVSQYKDKYERLKQKLEKYGKMYDEVESTLEQLRNKPFSKIGEIKNAADDLIGSFSDYDITKLLSADPDVVPRKVKEMQVLFNRTAEAFGEIDEIMKKCNVCNVEKIFGYNYMKSLGVRLSTTFNGMFDKLNVYAERIGDSMNDLQGVKTAASNIKTKFNEIKNKKFSVDTFKEISVALFQTTNDVNIIQNSTASVINILFKKDLDFQVIGGKINNVLSQISKVMNKSHVVATKGQKVYDKAITLKKDFLDLRANASGLTDGPLKSRIDVARNLAGNTKELLKELPELFNLSQATLESAGINGKWLRSLGGQLNGLTDSIGNVLEKTDKVLKASDVVVDGYENIKLKLPKVQESFTKLSEAKWDEMIPAFQETTKTLGNVFDIAINTTLKSAHALNYSITKNDLKSKVESVIGKERLAKYTGLYKNVSIAMTKLQAGPIGEIGKLTDSVENFVDGLEKYEFGKMLLHNPEDLRDKLREFEQLTGIAGGILQDISKITGLCKTCDASTIFGKGFIHSFAGRLETTFTKIGSNISSVIDRADLGLQGWGKIVGITKNITNHFKDLGNGKLTRETFDKAANALKLSSVDVLKLTNGSSDIFKAIFNGNNDMKYLQENFEGLVSHVSNVMNRSAIVLPKAGDVYESVLEVKSIFNEITDNFGQVQEGPIESRLKVLKKITKGVKSIGQTLPIIFNQSSDVVAGLGIDSSWFRRVTSRMVNVSNSLTNVMNKTDTVLNGAGLVMVDVREIQGLANSIGNDYQKILKAPWKQKFNIFNQALGKVDKMLNNTDSISETVEDTLKKAVGVDLDLSGSLGNITNKVSGMIGNLSKAVKKVSVIHTDIVSTIDQIKSGPIQKIGKLKDQTEEFVNSIKNYDLADILILAPKFAKGKIGDLKLIISESGGILSNISGLLDKHCKGCFDNIFGKGFVGNLSNRITGNLGNITSRVEGVLDKIENASTKVGGIINSVKGIQNEVLKLKGIDFNQDGFTTISNVLHKSSNLFDSIKNDSAGVFTALFSDNQDLLKLQGQFGGFINQMSAFLDKAGNFSTDIADAFGEFQKLKDTFDATKGNFKNLTTGPIENRVQAVKNIITGVNSIMKGFPEILKTSNLSPKWLRSFGTKLEGITSGVSSVLNKTSDIASGVGETIQGVQKIINTAGIIGKDFKRLFGSGSVGGKIVIAKNIVNKIKTLTGQVNSVASNTSNIFKSLTGKTLLKTDLIGDGATKLLDKISKGLDTVADRYEKFRDLSKSISEAFDKIKEDPIKFALEELPKVFEQASDFVGLIYSDIKGIAKDLGFNLNKFNLDTKLVNAAKQFFGFAQNALGAIGSGQTLVNDFDTLLKSKDFVDSMTNFEKVLDSGSNFLQSIDQLGSALFDKWDSIKENFNGALESVAESLGVNLQEMGGFLEKGLAVGGDALSIFSNIQSLLKMKEFSPEAIVKAANSILKIANSGINIANHFGANLASKGLENAAQFMGVVTAVVQLYSGIKGIIDWINDACDITYKSVVIPRELSYVCLKQKEYIEKVQVVVEKCSFVQKEYVRGYHEGKLCCPSKECVYMQSIACLKQNEQCLERKKKMVTFIPKLQKQLIVIYQNFHNSSETANARQKDVRTAEILLKRSKLALNVSNAALLKSEEFHKKALKSHQILSKQLGIISKMVHRNKSVITVQKARFDITTYKPDIKLLPIRLTLLNQANQISTVDVTFNKNQLSKSLMNAAHRIVSSYVDYIPISKRRRRNVDDAPVNVISQHGVKYWKLVCTTYQEHHEALNEIMNDLKTRLKFTSKQQKQKSKITTIPKSTSGSQSETTLLRELNNLEKDSQRSVPEVIQTWRRSSAVLMSSEIGSSCIGFVDCFDMFINNITATFEPEIDDYEEILKNIKDLNTTILLIANSDFNLNDVSKHVEEVFYLLEQLNKKAIFCDEQPSLKTSMKKSILAYLEDDLSLECTIEGPASMEYIWRRNGTILPEQSTWKLELKDVKKSDHGYYTCEGRTLSSQLISNKVLVRVDERLQLSTEPESHVLEYPGGQQVTLYCNGTAPPNPSYKWWFRKYNTLKPIVIGQKSILKITHVFSANTGEYWCELTNGFSTVVSQTATLDIVKTLQRKESARLNLNIITKKKDVVCSLPKAEQANNLRTIIKSHLVTKIGLIETHNSVNVKYKNNGTDLYNAAVVVDVSMRNKEQQPRDSVSFALSVSSERMKLKNKVSAYIDDIKQKNGLEMNWKKDCELTMQAVQFSVDWQVEELNCPKGMGPSDDQVKCVQCTPGKFDDGRGQCSKCPVGTYQPKLSSTTCKPCGVGRLTLQDGTVSSEDCRKIDYKCNDPMNVILLIDSSQNVSSSSWTSTKDFIRQLTRHQDLEDVKISVVSFGEKAELQFTPGDYDSDQETLENHVENIQPVGGRYNLYGAFELADKLIDPLVDKQRNVILLLTHNAKEIPNKEIITEKLDLMKERNIEVFTMVWKENDVIADDVIASFVSKPVFKHLFLSRDSSQLNDWATVTARATCRNVA